MGKTITTYLIDGTPKGVQTVVISNRTMIAYNIPRTRIDILREDERKELRTPALYILIGEEESGNPKAYIGETENFDKRVRDHINKKDFWQRALVFVSLAHDKTKADVQYLEKRSVELALKVNQYTLDENKQNPKNPTLTESQRSTDDEYFEDIRFIVSFMGYNIFEKAEVTDKSPMFYIVENGILAKGIYNDGGMTVLEGSKICVKESAKFRHPEQRAKMLKECRCVTKGQATRNSFISNVRHTVDTISKGELKSLQDLFAKVFNSIHNTEVKNLVEPIQTNNIKLSKYLNQTLTRQIKSILGLTNQNISNPSNVAELIYKIRCCIVHSKESEIHFTPNNISEYKDLIPVMRVLIKVIQNSIVETINNSGKKDLEFQSESMLLY